MVKEDGATVVRRLFAAMLCGLSSCFLSHEVAHAKGFYNLHGDGVICLVIFGVLAGAMVFFLAGSRFLSSRGMGSRGVPLALLWILSCSLAASVPMMCLQWNTARYTVETNLSYLDFGQFLASKFSKNYDLSHSGEFHVAVRRGDALALEEFLVSVEIGFAKRK